MEDLTWLNVSDVFLKQRFQLEAFLEIGNNRIESVVKAKAKSPKYILVK
tara:strand:- start:556 stop:702 length:147 start_codon:yes stop_codon:yes gene_type:complete